MNADLPSGGARRVRRLTVRSGTVTTETIAPPQLEPGHVRVEVEYAVLGTYPRADRDGPIGNEFSGRIVEVGTGVDPARLGERVVGITRSAAAVTELVIPTSGAYPIQDRFPGDIAPLALTIGLTAICLDLRFEIGPGRVALMLSPANATGCLFAGLTRRRGGTSVAWTPVASAVATLRTAGFDDVIVGAAPPDPARLAASTGGRLADLVTGGRIAPEAPWSAIGPLLTETGAAVRRPGTELGDWDPERARVFDVLSEAFDQFGSGDTPLTDLLAEPLDRLLDDVLAGELHLPVRVFDIAQAQTAYDLSTDAHVPEGIVIRIGSPDPA